MSPSSQAQAGRGHIVCHPEWAERLQYRGRAVLYVICTGTSHTRQWRRHWGLCNSRELINPPLYDIGILEGPIAQTALSCHCGGNFLSVTANPPEVVSPSYRISSGNGDITWRDLSHLLISSSVQVTGFGFDRLACWTWHRKFFPRSVIVGV